MNTRERFRATVNFEPLDRPLYWEFGYWVGTVRRWYREGLPCVHGVPDRLSDTGVVHAEFLGPSWRSAHCDVDVSTTLGFDEAMRWIPINNYLCPMFTTRVLEDQDEWSIMVNALGETVRTFKVSGSTQWLDAPVKTREDYETIRDQRLQPVLSERVPSDWPAVKEELKRRTYPLAYGGFQGFFNTSRRLLGYEGLMMAFYDRPALVKDIVSDTCDLLIALYDPVLSEVPGDCALISEDICYKGGCLISPATFREFYLPVYRRLIGFYRDHGIRTILVDSDGDVTGLIPLLIEAGVTGLYPFEVTGKCDVRGVRRAFPRFQIMGGIDKKAVAAGRDAIDRELESKVPSMLPSGGYIPFIDHNIPPDIPWENFLYYRGRLAELAGQDSEFGLDRLTNIVSHHRAS